MINEDRIEQFTREVADLKLKTSGGAGERVAGAVGLVLMALGTLVAVVSSLQAGGKEDPRDLTELLILNTSMISAVVTGGFLFLRTALLAFWRFWMLRQLYENQSYIEELLTSRDRH